MDSAGGRHESNCDLCDVDAAIWCANQSVALMKAFLLEAAADVFATSWKHIVGE